VLKHSRFIERKITMPNPTDLNAVLVWLASAGAPYLVAQVLSLLAANWKVWDGLPKFVKFIVPIVLSPLVAVGATLLLKSTDVITLVSPWWAIIVGSITAYLGSQQAYMATKRAGYGTEAKK
jgi:hypothetical protein